MGVRRGAPPRRRDAQFPYRRRTRRAGVRNRLRELGHAEGRDILVETRSADGDPAALPRLAAELAASKPSVIVSAGTATTLAAWRDDPPDPIVVLTGHAMRTGFAAESSARREASPA